LKPVAFKLRGNRAAFDLHRPTEGILPLRLRLLGRVLPRRHSTTRRTLQLNHPHQATLRLEPRRRVAVALTPGGHVVWLHRAAGISWCLVTIRPTSVALTPGCPLDAVVTWTKGVSSSCDLTAKYDNVVKTGKCQAADPPLPFRGGCADQWRLQDLGALVQQADVHEGRLAGHGDSPAASTTRVVVDCSLETRTAPYSALVTSTEKMD
jgi:hypothetical protein